MRKKRLAIALGLMVIVLVPVFSYFAYIANDEKTAMDNLAFVITSASFDSIVADTVNNYITGSVVVLIRLINPTGHNTPTFSVDFAWYISLTAAVNDGEYCGSEALESLKIPSDHYSDSTFNLSFNITHARLQLFDAIQAGEVNIILGGSARGKVFFGLLAASKSFLEFRMFDK